METLESLRTAIPEREVIYHYTSQEGLLGIIQQRALWTSSIRHLNDSTEFEYSVQLVRTILNGRLRHERGPWNGYYGAILTGLDAIKDMTLFVGSFSENGDLLSQWRAYAPGGIGFSIGFKHKYLRSLAATQKFSFVKCSYSELDNAEILNQIINAGGQLVVNGDHRAAVESFFIALFKIAPAFKHPSFSEEKEWRLVSEVILQTDTETQFRTGKSMLIPYRNFRLTDTEGRMPVSKVFIGPTPHKELSISSVTHFLFSQGIIDGVVATSSVPYRTW